MNDTWMDDLVGDEAHLTPRPGFVGELRSTLSEEWHSPAVVGLAEADDPTTASHRWLMLAAASLLLVAVAGLIAVTGDNQNDVTVLTTPTVAPTTPTSTAAPATNSAPPNPEIDPPSPLEDWPTSWTEPPMFSTVPLLFPTIPVPGATGALRSAGDNAAYEPDLSPFHQVWYSDDGSAFLQITTRLGQDLIVPPGIDPPGINEVTIGSWDRAWFTATDEGPDNMKLIAPEGEVSISSQGVERDAVLDMARTLTRRPDGRPGWDVATLPPSLVFFGESDAGDGQLHVQWTSDTSPYLGLGAEMKIHVGSPETLRDEFPVQPNQYIETVVSINGATAYLKDGSNPSGLPGLVELVWSPEPGVVVVFVLVGTREDALATARSIELVDQTTWDASTDINNRPPHDGCDSLFC